MALIYLDVDDEITSAASRIRAAEDERIALVLPYGSRLATSRINFRLLAREATERGKQIEIVCADPSARALAAAAGLPVHPSVSAFEGHGAGATVATAPHEASPGDVDDPDGAGSAGDNGTGATPVGAGVASDTGPGVAGVPVGGLNIDGGPDIDEDTQTRVLTQPRKSSPRVPRVGPPRPPVRTRLAVGIGLAAVALVVVGGILALELLPSATIVLAPRSEEIGPIELTIEARSDVTAPDPATLTIPALRLTFDLEATQKITATGTKVTETTATGNVTFSNNDTGGSNRIPAGSIVSTESGVEFATVAAVTLPPAFLFPFFPSSASVGVTAVASGPDGNVEKETITIVPKGENRVLLQVTNREPTTGGERTESPEVSQADVDAALLAIDGALAAELNEQVSEGTTIPPGVEVFDQTQVVGPPEFATDPASLVGSASLEVDLVATAEGSILGVDSTPIEAIAQARLQERVAEGWALAPGSTTFDLGVPTVLGETVVYPVSIAATQVRDVDQAALAELVRGLLLADARSQLDDFGNVEITLWPDWVTTIPRSPDRITFTLVDAQPAPSPTP